MQLSQNADALAFLDSMLDLLLSKRSEENRVGSVLLHVAKPQPLTLPLKPS